MGYYISLVDCEFKIKAENHEKALAAIIALTEPKLMEKQARGGSWKGGGGGRTECWYSWVNTEALRAAVTLEDAISKWGWGVELDYDNGDIIGLHFSENKVGQEELMFKAIAPFVEDGSWIHIQGEDGSQWRWFFDGGDMFEQTPSKIVWS